jgi:hypothetical protein
MTARDELRRMLDLRDWSLADLHKASDLVCQIWVRQQHEQEWQGRGGDKAAPVTATDEDESGW